ncbi:MAG TPA: tetratricopeptide repeat protein, partial [Pirellulales bacterium]
MGFLARRQAIVTGQRAVACWAVLGVLLACHAAMIEAAPPAERDQLLPARDRLRAEAQELLNRGKGAEAMRAAQDALAISKKLFAANPAETLADWTLIGNVAEEIDDWQAAIDARNEAVRICATAAGKDHWVTTDLRVEAEKTARLKELSPADRRSLKRAIQDQAGIRQQFEAAHYAEALEIAERCRNVYERLWGAEHAETAAAWNDVGTVRQTQGDYAAGESAFRRALSIREKTLGAGHPLTAASLSNLGLLFSDQGKYAAAEEVFLRARQAVENAVGPDDMRSLTVVNNLALVHLKLGEFARAETSFRHVLKAFERIYGEEHALTADVLNNLASACANQGKDAEAERLMRRALAMRRKECGERHPKTAMSLNNLA